MIRVLHIVGSARPGGTESFVRDLLAATSTNRFRSAVCILGESGAMVKEFAAHAQVSVLGIENSSRALSAVRLARMLSRTRYDIVHSHSGGGTVARVARRVGKARVITHFHSITDLGIDLLRSDAPGLDNLLARRAEGSDQLIGCSLWMTSLLRERLLRFPAPIDCIHNGVDLSRFAGYPSTPPRLQTRERGAEFVVGFAGRLVRQKGLHFLLDTAALMRDLAPAVRFMIAGDGPLRHELENRASVEHLSNVRFLGELADIRPALATFDVAVIPSEWEPFGIVALEAMAMGLPVVASDVDGLPEVVEDNKTGLLVPFGNADRLSRTIQRLRDNPSLRQEFGVNGRRRVELEFDSRMTARAVERVYDRLLSTR